MERKTDEKAKVRGIQKVYIRIARDVAEEFTLHFIY